MGISSSTPGSPLTEDEYRDFFSSWKPEWKMMVLCQIRRDKGCLDPRIVQTDQLENHGQVPDGPVCADLPQNPSFESFCLFAQYRCSNQQLYTKRILCPKQSLTEESYDPTEGPYPSTLEAHEQHHQTATEMHQETTVSTLESIKILIPKMAMTHHGVDIHANVDEILKFAFSASGQEPVLKEHTSTPHGNRQTGYTSTPHGNKQTGYTSTPHGKKQSTQVSKVHHRKVTTHAKTSFSKRKSETTERHTRSSVQQHHRPALSQKKPLKVKKKATSKDRKHRQNFQEVIPETKYKGSFYDLEKDEALVILCYALLQDSCISSAVSKAWKQMEAKTLGYGDLVCDNFGRHHKDLCSECAFCSLKTEQCKGVSHLHRIPCGRGPFTTYINPEILDQYQANSAMVVPLQKEKRFIQKVQENLQLKYWCGILASYGCDDPRIVLWLQTEYSQFQGGNFPHQICDSTRILHPNYCAFKSYECLLNSERKVWRCGCQINVMYRMLSKEEGEAEVRLWSQRFFNIVRG